MTKGRPLKTEIREKVAHILRQINAGYGYQIYKIYNEVFGRVSLRNLYYNLKKGALVGEFVVVDIKLEKGSFTWGGQVEHKYYALGPYALVGKITEKQQEKLKKLTSIEIVTDWNKELKGQIIKLEKNVGEFLAVKSRLKYEDKRKIENNLKSCAEHLKEWAKQKIRDSTHISFITLELKRILGMLDSHTP